MREQILIPGKIYNLKYYGKAIFKEQVNTPCGYMWNFEALENTHYMTFKGRPFSLQYDSRGLELIRGD